MGPHRENFFESYHGSSEITYPRTVSREIATLGTGTNFSGYVDQALTYTPIPHNDVAFERDGWGRTLSTQLTCDHSMVRVRRADDPLPRTRSQKSER